MSSTINIPLIKGINTIGNSLNVGIPITTFGTVSVIKTLDNNIWSSTVVGSPVEFQEVKTIGKGKGYVVQSNEAVTVPVTGDLINPSDVPVSITGLSMIAIPFDHRVIGGGQLPIGDFTKIITYDGVGWKSWVKDSPSNFQGVTHVEQTKGYVTTISKKYNNYITSNNVIITDHIQFMTTNKSMVNEENYNGMGYVDPHGVGVLMYTAKDISKIDISNPPGIMFIELGTKLAKINVPLEYMGERFYVKTSDNTIYTGKFVDKPLVSEPVTLTQKIVNKLEINYTKLSLSNPVTTTNNMLLPNGDGTFTAVHYDPRYEGKDLSYWKTDTGTLVQTKFTKS